jgi:hypothetical protein
VKIGQVAVALVEVEAVADEELVRHREADVANRQVVDEASVRPVEERDRGERGRLAERKRAADVVQRQPGVDDILDEQDVAAGDREVEILDQSYARLGAPASVARERDEVDRMRDGNRAREVCQEEDARLQRGDEDRLAPLVVAGDLGAELRDARLDLAGREVDLTERLLGLYEARSSLYRSARR